MRQIVMGERGNAAVGVVREVVLEKLRPGFIMMAGHERRQDVLEGQRDLDKVGEPVGRFRQERTRPVEKCIRKRIIQGIGIGREANNTQGTKENAVS